MTRQTSRSPRLPPTPSPAQHLTVNSIARHKANLLHLPVQHLFRRSSGQQRLAPVPSGQSRLLLSGAVQARPIYRATQLLPLAPEAGSQLRAAPPSAYALAMRALLELSDEGVHRTHKAGSPGGVPCPRGHRPGATHDPRERSIVPKPLRCRLKSGSAAQASVVVAPPLRRYSRALARKIGSPSRARVTERLPYCRHAGDRRVERCCSQWPVVAGLATRRDR
jgi:hypothetical protein